MAVLIISTAIVFYYIYLLLPVILLFTLNIFYNRIINANSFSVSAAQLGTLYSLERTGV